MKKIVCMFLVAVLIFTLCACGNSAEKQSEIIAMFESFENSDNYILVTLNETRIGDKVIDNDDIKYDGQKCTPIFCEEKGMYAYSSEETDEGVKVNLVFVEFKTLQARYISTFVLQSGVIAAEHYNNCIYFRVSNPKGKGQLYFTYNLKTAETGMIPTDDLDADLGFDIEYSADHNRSSIYRIQSDNRDVSTFFTRNKVKITDKRTGESKSLSRSILKTFKEGKEILKIGKVDVGGFTETYEKDGIIYAVGYCCTDGSLGDPSHLFIIKYDFEKETAEYYTSVLFEKYPEHVVDLYIP